MAIRDILFTSWLRRSKHSAEVERLKIERAEAWKLYADITAKLQHIYYEEQLLAKPAPAPEFPWDA